jgi:endonuclease YncB( thermonuclease family)
VPVVLIALLFGLFFQVAPPDASVDATVNQVIDGSTLDAQVNDMRTPVGYLGIDTPALNQRCGQQAMQRNRDLIGGGGHVLLATDPLYQFDDHHRQLFYAYTVDGVSIEETLLNEGLAVAVRTDAGRGADLAALQAAAQASGQGCLWSSQ